MTQELNSDIVIDRIRKKMLEHHMNQSALAREAGITPAALSQILNKERSPSTGVLIKLANTLGVTVDYLLGRIDTIDIASVLANPDTLNLYQSFSSLNRSEKSQVMDMIAFLKQRHTND